MQKILVDQDRVKKLLAAGMKSYTIEKCYGIPRSVVDDIKAGRDRPYFFKKPKRNKKDMCECCGYKEKAPGFAKLCLVCHRQNSNCVGDDEYNCSH